MASARAPAAPDSSQDLSALGPEALTAAGAGVSTPFRVVYGLGGISSVAFSPDWRKILLGGRIGSSTSEGMAVDGDGKAHLVWQRGEEVWHVVYSSGTFTAAQPISGALGVDPAIAFGPTLIEGSSPGLVVVWQAGFGNDAHLRYGLEQPGAGDVYSWTVPITLTTDAYGDIDPTVVITGTATPLVLWLQRD